MCATQARGTDGRILFHGAVVAPTTAWPTQIAEQRPGTLRLPPGAKLRRLDVPELRDGHDPLLDYYLRRVAPQHAQLVVLTYP